MITVDDLKRMLEVQLPPTRNLARVRGLLVAPDVWSRLLAEVPQCSPGQPSPIWQWHVTVVRELPAGAIVPVDEKGRPMVNESEEQS